MIAGIILILCGIMIALYPPLLSLVVAVLLISIGAILCAASFRYKKMSRQFDDPFVDFFMKL
ncbi:MAG: hypothetical protein WBB86_07070 [Candidatus Omnitrophota bacterium]